MICTRCQSPDRKVWTYAFPPQLEEVSGSQGWGALYRCPSCSKMWYVVAYEPFSSFPFWIQWNYTEDDWHWLKKLEDGRTIARWHEAVLISEWQSLPPNEQEAISAWRKRARNYTPIDLRSSNFVSENLDIWKHLK